MKKLPYCYSKNFSNALRKIFKSLRGAKLFFKRIKKTKILLEKKPSCFGSIYLETSTYTQ